MKLSVLQRLRDSFTSYLGYGIWLLGEEEKRVRPAQWKAQLIEMPEDK